MKRAFDYILLAAVLTWDILKELFHELFTASA